MRRNLLREETPSPSGATPDTCVVAQDPPGRRTSLEDLFRREAASGEDSLSDVVLDVNKADDEPHVSATTRPRGRNETSHTTHTTHDRVQHPTSPPRSPQVVVSYEQTHAGGKQHARTQVIVTGDGSFITPPSDTRTEIEREDTSFKGKDSFARPKPTPWNDRGSGFYEKQRKKCRQPALVATGTHAGASLVKVRGRSLLKLLKHDAFTSLIEVHWSFLLLVVCAIHLVTFFVFAGLWDGVHNANPKCLIGFDKHPWSSALIFSIATQSTLGYGTRGIVSGCRVGTALLLVQTMVGVLVSATSLGLIFQRITDPQRRGRSIFISDAACIATRDGELKLMFRVADARDRKVIAPVIRACLYTWTTRTTSEGEEIPVLAQPISISKLDPLMLLPITVEHVIDENSPLFRHTHDSLVNCGAEIVVAFEGCIDATGLSFSARQSYLPSEILWGHTFRKVIRQAPAGATRHEVALGRFHELEPQALLESDWVRKRLGGRGHMVLTAQQMCEASIEASRGGGRGVVPFPVVGANTLVIADSCVLSSDKKLTFRVADTRSPWGSQFVNVRTTAHLHVWHARDQVHESFELELTNRNSSAVSSKTKDRGVATSLWAPTCVEHALGSGYGSDDGKFEQQDGETFSPVVNAFCFPNETEEANANQQHPTLHGRYQDAVIVVQVDAVSICDGTPKTRRRCFRARDIATTKTFAQITSPPKRNKLWAEPGVDFGKFHDLV